MRVRSTLARRTNPALTTEADQRAAREAGASSFLAKPFDPDELHAAVDELIAAR